jgi:hypothetical protein
MKDNSEAIVEDVLNCIRSHFREQNDALNPSTEHLRLELIEMLLYGLVPSDESTTTHAALIAARIEPELPLQPIAVGSIYEGILALEAKERSRALSPTIVDRKRLGSHYTPSSLADDLIELTLVPLLEQCNSSSDILQLRICDPSCGVGVFLLSAARAMALRLCLLDGCSIECALAQIVQSCIYGVDIDPVAVLLCRNILASECNLTLDNSSVFTNVQHGDALVGVPFNSRSTEPVLPVGSFNWNLFQPIQSGVGFDLVVGNPPWQSFSGRSAVPLDKDRERYFQENYRSFKKWPSLHALFVERGLAFLGDRGLLAMLLPKSVVTLSGYEPMRTAVVAEAPAISIIDFGEHCFEDVVQATIAIAAGRHRIKGLLYRSPPFSFPTESSSLDSVFTALEHLERPSPESFGDIGVHSGNCAKSLVFSQAEQGCVPIREGRDVHCFEAGPNRRWLQKDYKAKQNEYFRLGNGDRQLEAPILIRQTASRPIAASNHPPMRFRNSVLACWGIDGWPDPLSLAWLNSTAIAWYHQRKEAESRQRAFPQMKIRHLRQLPLPQWKPSTVQLILSALAEESPDGQSIDLLVSSAFNIDKEAHGLMKEALR